MISFLWSMRSISQCVPTRLKDLPQPNDGICAILTAWINVEKNIIIGDQELLECFVNDLHRDNSYLITYKAVEDFFYAMLPDALSPGCPLASKAQPQIVEIMSKSGCACRSSTECSQPSAIAVYTLGFPSRSLKETVEESFTSQTKEKCRSCNQTCNQKVRKVLTEATAVFVVSIDRMEWNPDTNTSIKNNSSIEIGGPITIPTMGGPSKYQVVSAVEHKGLPTSGHYTAHIFFEHAFVEVDGASSPNESTIDKCVLFLYKKID